MFSKKPLKISLFPVANILGSLILLWAFFSAGLNVVQTFPVAHMSALSYLKPQSMDYFWDININDAPIDKSRIRYYLDYYENLLQVFPGLRDAYGIIGYCYHYLGDDAKAIDNLKKAVTYNPLYLWNYYNLAVIYISQSDYQDASVVLQKILSLDPQQSLQRMFQSQYIYIPILESGGKDAIHETAEHLKLSYKASFDLVQLINQIQFNKEAEEIMHRMKLVVYAF